MYLRPDVRYLDAVASIAEERHRGLPGVRFVLGADLESAALDLREKEDEHRAETRVVQTGEKSITWMELPCYYMLEGGHN